MASWSTSVRFTMSSLMVLALIAAVTTAYNDDRPIYKWSPLWFNSYLRRGVLHKRFNDDSPIYKWSPMWLDRDGYRRLHYIKRSENELRSANCLPEWSSCRPDDKPCCSGACFEGACIGSGEYYDGEYDR